MYLKTKTSFYLKETFFFIIKFRSNQNKIDIQKQ
jgi:hypothetical protein